MALSPRPTTDLTPISRLAGALAGGVLVLVLAGACSSSTEVTAGDPGQVSTNPIPGSALATSTTATGATVPSTAPGPVPADSSTTTTTAAVPPVGSSPSVPVAVSVPVSTPAPADPSIETQVFWVRSPAEDRIVDLPGYRDPVAGPRPLVLYGSVTNIGAEPIVNPFVTATWLDGSGTPQAAFTAPVLAPGGSDPVAVLEPGAMADVLVVIADPDQIGALADLAAELRLGSR